MIGRSGRRPVIGERRNVLIDSSYRHPIAFVMMDIPRKDKRGKQTIERRAMGTAFFLTHKIDLRGMLVYAITARHVIDAGEIYGARGLYLRMRHSVGRGFEDVPMKADQWARHPTTDVAVARVELPSNVATMGHRIDVLATPERLARLEEDDNLPIGEGDDVFIVGMFSRHYGEEQLLPIVRFGNIALMPHEPVETQISPAKDAPYVQIDVYLVEVRSWGGHSGSPVWVYFPSTRVSTQGVRFNDLAATQPVLLGLVQAHYPIDPDEPVLGDIDGNSSLAANAGIAIVVPADKIREVLMDDQDLTKERDDILAERNRRERERSGPVLDSQEPEQPDDEFERFEDLTRKLVNTPKPKKE